MPQRLPQVGRGVEHVGGDDDVVVPRLEALRHRVALDVEQRARTNG